MNFVKIGNLEWCSEDARFTQMSNGDIFPIAKNIEEWNSYCLNDEPCCCAYDFNEKNSKKYGLIYNVHVVFQAETIVPEGTRLATYADWLDLIESLGSNIPIDKHSQSEALLKLKSEKDWSGKINFTYPLTGTNESGFSAIPGGVLISDSINGSQFLEKGKGAHWWTSDFAHPHITPYDNNKFKFHPPIDPEIYVDLKKSNFKEGRYLRLVKK